MQRSLFASLNFQIYRIRNVLRLQGLVNSVHMSSLQLVDTHSVASQQIW